MARFVAVPLVCLLFILPALSQGAPASDPQAVSFAAQSMAALTSGTTIGDVTLTGTVTWGGSDTGTATLSALGTGESRIDLALTSGTRTEIRDAQTGIQQGQWFAPNSVSGYFAFHNCWTDAVWFFPALGSLAGGPNVVLSYIGPENRNGGAVQHLQSYVYQSVQFPDPTPQQLSIMDFYLDATTLLPVAVTFSAHPDDDATTDLLVEIDFSNYQSINGVAVPIRIQRYQQGNLMADVTLSGASFNTGLALSTFTIN
jgi:hypothetical protein